jgi:hypothetical protein
VSFPATILIPLLSQREDWLEQCVRSAITQTEPAEIIVVTTGGTPCSNLDLLTQLQRECNNLRIHCQSTPALPRA